MIVLGAGGGHSHGRRVHAPTVAAMISGKKARLPPLASSSTAGPASARGERALAGIAGGERELPVAGQGGAEDRGPRPGRRTPAGRAPRGPGRSCRPRPGRRGTGSGEVAVLPPVRGALPARPDHRPLVVAAVPDQDEGIRAEAEHPVAEGRAHGVLPHTGERFSPVRPRRLRRRRPPPRRGPRHRRRPGAGRSGRRWCSMAGCGNHVTMRRAYAARRLPRRPARPVTGACGSRRLRRRGGTGAGRSVRSPA